MKVNKVLPNDATLFLKDGDKNALILEGKPYPLVSFLKISFYSSVYLYKKIVTYLGAKI